MSPSYKCNVKRTLQKWKPVIYVLLNGLDVKHGEISENIAYFSNLILQNIKTQIRICYEIKRKVWSFIYLIRLSSRNVFLTMFSFICKFYCSIYQSLALTNFCQGVHNLQFKWHTSIKTNRWIICYTIYTCGNLSAQTADLLNWEYKSQDFGSVSRHSV